MSNSAMPDLFSVLANLAAHIGPAIMVLQSIAFLMGLWFVSAGLIEIFQAADDNAVKYLGGNKRFSALGGGTSLAVGAVLTAMGTLEMVGILSRTVTGDYANSRYLSYTPGSGSFEEQRLVAMGALLGIMQIVGFVAMLNGWVTVNRWANNQGQAGIGQALAWLGGGVVAWNFKWFTDVLNCSLGFNMIGLFAPFGARACGH